MVDKAGSRNVIFKAYLRRLVGFSLLGVIQLAFWFYYVHAVSSMSRMIDDYGIVIACLILLLMPALTFIKLCRRPAFAKFLLHVMFAIYVFSLMTIFKNHDWDSAAILGIGLMGLSASLVFNRMSDFCFAAVVMIFSLVVYPGLPWDHDPVFSAKLLMTINILLCVVFGGTLFNWRISPEVENLTWIQRNSEYAWCQLFKNNPTPTILVDRLSRIKSCNQAFLDMIGYEADEITKMRMAELQLVEKDTNAYVQVQEAFKKGFLDISSAGWLTKQGRLIDLSLKGTVIHSVEGEVLQVLLSRSTFDDSILSVA